MTEVEAPQAKTWSERVAKYMGERPVLTLATAAIVGLAVGWMAKRK